MLNKQSAAKKERSLDREITEVSVKLLPGEFFATADGTAIATVLGSCVAVCLFDPGSGIGGMNHFMLPELQQGMKAGKCTGDCSTSNCTRYGSCAIRRLLQQLEELGAVRVRLKAKLFGGGRVMAGMSDIGEKNAVFATEQLARQRIPVTASDLGGCWPRKVVFYPAEGRALVKRLLKLPVEEMRASAPGVLWTGKEGKK
ncbi:histidine kinase [Geomonas sp.]|uniref:histidine kinase n=1 Tax=Geomonas sp. TaxID=2651584 RepID=UPI002B4A2CEB|nr:histidine kinase [Geomonas sp.]HJV35002.1 histidine kinase [Geomonas sp.]